MRPSPRVEAFLQGLRDLGYVEGQNVLVERRFWEGRQDRLPGHVADLVRLPVDLIVAPDPPSAHAARDATRTTPIVMRSSDDPVKSGFVASLARPGGNITGVYSLYSELTPKRLELLKDAVPRVKRVGVLWNPAFPGSALEWKTMEAAARALGLELLSLEVRRPDDLEGAFRAATGRGAGALLPLRSPLIVSQAERIASLAPASRLPAIYDDRDFVDVGGLMSYGANLADLYRRCATYADRILKGARPADLPVEQAARFELVINLRAAKALGLAIPQPVLLRAEEVMR